MGSIEIPKWLQSLPLAPEFRPTDTEFADPIAYISKIEKEAREFGICKVIPPFPRPSKRYVFNNLNKSLSKNPELGKISKSFNSSSAEERGLFTTRQQELGIETKKTKAENAQVNAHKKVWQSGNVYTLDQFEAKSKAFAKSVLHMTKDNIPLAVESLFWKAASDKAMYIEYANDVPGSGFSEPEGHLLYFQSRRRKKDSYQSYRRDRVQLEIKDLTNLSEVFNHDPLKNDSETGGNQSLSDSSGSQDENPKVTKRKNGVASEMEGSAGWKLSNSPWNLQVIARSPGSLTRYMPDDIPGVTSPMIYIGMLFSWFAWHVEDHELHSLNFLHTGSPKTWYAVPGSFAHTFEELIRNKAYEGNLDRLAALRVLGEKTTLLSPEIVVASNIPCCRLIQNPGEFVVTFPSAYHVGFSHGFNCGEAANFGTPRWLEVAKDAAVRRASMNYLPMLSHQQLMYLLAMSFVSRVPRSLLPGVRCSRLRDRQRDERELSVKKAFIKDLLQENHILYLLLGSNTSYHAVLWNEDLLPGVTKESNTASQSFNDCQNGRNLFDEMKSCMGNLNDSFLEDKYLLSEFHIDSGTLACVACGILGYPFMCVIQPSNSMLPSNEDSSSVKTDVSPGWNLSSKFIRPRLFCMEHGSKVVDILKCKGGASMLVICHSDFQKIKANSAVIAEETCGSFDFHEIEIGAASHEELNVIETAIDDEDDADVAEDWTSSLKVNLQHCVKMKKAFPMKKFDHALGLFSVIDLPMNWQSRKSRSKMKTRRLLASQSHRSCVPMKEERKVVQYSRRKRKKNSVKDEVVMFIRGPCEGLRPRLNRLDLEQCKTRRFGGERKRVVQKCDMEQCGLSFRFDSNFSKRRRTGHNLPSFSAL